MTLEQIVRDHAGKLVHKWEGYFAHYERSLHPLRNRPVRLLEIGVQNGGSQEVWSRYFAQARVLVGCDIDTLCGNLKFDDPRIKVVVGDANSVDVRKRILDISPRFDVIIDDGSHTSGDIIRAFCFFFPLLENGGIYIAEDLHCSYWQNYEGGLFHPYSSLSFFKHLADIPNREHWGVDWEEDQMLGGLLQHHRAPISAEDLRHIHAVEFANSLCFIRKDAPRHNGLGRRVVGGVTAMVSSAPREAEVSIEVPSQSGNPWSLVEETPGVILREIARRFTGDKVETMGVERLTAAIHAENDALRARLHQFESSLLWRCGVPFRWVRSIIDYGPLRLLRGLVRYLRPRPPGWDASRYIKSHWSTMGQKWARFPWLHSCLFADQLAAEDVPVPSVRDRAIPNASGFSVSPEVVRAPTDRKSFFGRLSLADGLGLEIGPLHDPMCVKPHCDVRYLDVFGADELRRNYAGDPDVDLDRIVDVDLVWKGELYGELTHLRFDYAVSSHNLEHTPCLISFFRNIQSCLQPGGKVYLAVPDKRYCFDHFKPETSLVDIIEAYRERVARPRPKSILGHRLYATHNDSGRHWRGDHGQPAYLSNGGVVALDVLEEWSGLEGADCYTDTHTWVFTPGSFADILAFLRARNLINLQVVALYPTAQNAQEFFVELFFPVSPVRPAPQSSQFPPLARPHTTC